MTGRAPLPDDDAAAPEGPPPVLGTWRRAYVAVVGWLALLILLFYLFGWRFTS